MIHSPQRVRRLVAHEPPFSALVSPEQQAELRRAYRNIQSVYQTGGVNAAIHQFASSLGIARGGKERETMELLQLSEPNASHNREAFIRYEMPAVANYRLDIDALRVTPTWVVIAGGHDSHETWPYHATQALAEQLDSPLVEFPGDHAGFVAYPIEFADTLQAVLKD